MATRIKKVLMNGIRATSMNTGLARLSWRTGKIWLALFQFRHFHFVTHRFGIRRTTTELTL